MGVVPQLLHQRLKDQLVGPSDKAFHYTGYVDSPAALRSSTIYIEEPCPSADYLKKNHLITSSLLSIFGIYIHLSSQLIIVRVANKSSFAIRKTSFDFQDVISRSERNSLWLTNSLVPNTHFVTNIEEGDENHLDISSNSEADEEEQEQEQEQGDDDEIREFGSETERVNDENNNTNSSPIISAIDSQTHIEIPNESQSDDHQDEHISSEDVTVDYSEVIKPLVWEELFSDLLEQEKKYNVVLPREVTMQDNISVTDEPLPFLPIYIGYRSELGQMIPIDFSRPYKRQLKEEINNLILFQRIYTNLSIKTTEIRAFRTPNVSAISECIGDYFKSGALLDIAEYVITWFGSSFTESYKFKALEEETAGADEKNDKVSPALVLQGVEQGVEQEVEKEAVQEVEKEEAAQEVEAEVVQEVEQTFAPDVEEVEVADVALKSKDDVIEKIPQIVEDDITLKESTSNGKKSLDQKNQPVDDLTLFYQDIPEFVETSRQEDTSEISEPSEHEQENDSLQIDTQQQQDELHDFYDMLPTVVSEQPIVIKDDDVDEIPSNSSIPTAKKLSREKEDSDYIDDGSDTNFDSLYHNLPTRTQTTSKPPNNNKKSLRSNSASPKKNLTRPTKQSNKLLYQFSSSASSSPIESNPYRTPDERSSNEETSVNIEESPSRVSKRILSQRTDSGLPEIVSDATKSNRLSTPKGSPSKVSNSSKKRRRNDGSSLDSPGRKLGPRSTRQKSNAAITNAELIEDSEISEDPETAETAENPKTIKTTFKSLLGWFSET